MARSDGSKADSSHSPLLLATEPHHKGKLGLSDCVKGSLMVAIWEEEEKIKRKKTFLIHFSGSDFFPFLFWELKEFC